MVLMIKKVATTTLIKGFLLLAPFFGTRLSIKMTKASGKAFISQKSQISQISQKGPGRHPPVASADYAWLLYLRPEMSTLLEV